jgi:hypothetical protein
MPQAEHAPAKSVVAAGPVVYMKEETHNGPCGDTAQDPYPTGDNVHIIRIQLVVSVLPRSAQLQDLRFQFRLIYSLESGEMIHHRAPAVDPESCSLVLLTPKNSRQEHGGSREKHDMKGLVNSHREPAIRGSLDGDSQRLHEPLGETPAV